MSEALLERGVATLKHDRHTCLQLAEVLMPGSGQLSLFPFSSKCHKQTCLSPSSKEAVKGAQLYSQEENSNSRSEMSKLMAPYQRIFVKHHQLEYWLESYCLLKGHCWCVPKACMVNQEPNHILPTTVVFGLSQSCNHLSSSCCISLLCSVSLKMSHCLPEEQGERLEMMKQLGK